ncbi:MAG: NADH-quinone oxidoreductase subunit NuoG [Tahibacter sp.]
MNAQVSNVDAPVTVVPEGHVTIEIDGKSMFAPKGSMIIHAADKAGVAIPRFCYHDKLAIAANCRMCLVEVEKSPKPMPACATPVMDGMKVQTRSQKALGAQRNVMEFLLINHPLDCPICDQGGECELQDVAMGYGRSVSRFVERKRVVADEDIGPLIATDMTRCIQCTRCVRFVGEVAGTYELGGLGRGENLEIGTYIGKTIDSEIGGNIIDVCPVGALTNKVFRFKARAWELTARESIGYHDALGSNLWLHTRRGEVLRSVPRDNESINECWLSDRDRYSHEGLTAPDRAQRPMIRKHGALVEVSWDEAIAFVAAGLKRYAASDIGALVAPLASNEEGYLLAQLLRGLGSAHIDHRLRQLDFADAANGFGFEMPVEQIEKATAIVLLGSNLRHELPLVNQRVRKAVKRGAVVHALNPLDFGSNVDFSSNTVLAPAAFLEASLRLARAAHEDGSASDAGDLAAVWTGVEVDDKSRALYVALKKPGSVLIFGNAAAMHPQASILRAAARYTCRASGAKYNEIPLGANSRGLSAMGVLPGGGGLDAASLIAKPRKALLVYQAGSQDVAQPAAFEHARQAAEFYVYAGAYACDGVRRSAQAVLPLGLPPEIDGSYTNVDGIVQQVSSGAALPGEARPGWKVLRALGAALGVSGFDFTDIGGVRERIAALPKAAATSNGKVAARAASVPALARIATVPIYRGDAVLRRSAALQAHPLTRDPGIDLHPDDASARAVEHGSVVKVSGPLGTATLPVRINPCVPRGGAWIETGSSATAGVPAYGAELVFAKA